MRFIYVDFAFLGNESVDASEAGQCAHEQGKFWEYHDLLFQNHTGENVGDYKRENLDKYARQIGLNMTQFGACLDTKKYRPFIAALGNEARTAGVRSTPTLFVNQRVVPGFVPYLKEKQERSLLVAPGVTMTDQAKMVSGATVCLTGEVDSNRRISKGTVTSPPGGDDALCGDVKQFTPSTADRAGEIILVQEVPGLKDIIEEELKKPK